MNQKNVRKALERTLDAALATVILPLVPQSIRDMDGWAAPGVIQVRRQNIKFDASQPFYLKTDFAAPNKRFNELGRRARADVSGTLLIGIFAPPDTGEDWIDDIADAIVALYPHAAVLTFRDAAVEIDVARAPPGALTDDHWFKPVMVTWNVWRAAQ